MATWLSDTLDSLPRAPDAPVAWSVRLDRPATPTMVARASLLPDDLTDLAKRPDAGMRGLRRRLARLLVATATGEHPDLIRIERSRLGAPVVVVPDGWHISLAGQWPFCAIALSRAPVGIDVEPLATAALPLDLFTAAEHSAFKNEEPIERLFRWIAKEAHAKRLGRASLADPARIETWRSHGELLVRCADGISRCEIRILNDAAHALAIAAES
ncbi:MAG: 4'-phosphopantetheinyl transferase superfamily protein [Candidatus Sphingomonas phytovorans]|nr:4'-phosphopantetheinyl transferase superfamily protein [Sphingomonas sp.]WEK01549.1 MAG: 4'-phosphopantetheinyl transferase superfamily protein [Sphingomonas sp.]